MKVFRKQKGSATIAETGPALFIFLLLIFFPLVDVIGMGLSFSCAWYLNHLTTRELACRTQADGAQAQTDITTNFCNSGLAAFLRITSSDVTHTPTYNAPSAAGLQPTITCTTTVRARPMLVLPLPPHVPGLNDPVTFTLSSERPREEIR